MESPLAESSTERFTTHQYPIEQLPSRNRYNERQSLLDKFDFSDICIPSNFPSSVSSDRSWSMKTPVLDGVTLSLSSSDIEELETAMQAFQGILSLSLH